MYKQGTYRLLSNKRLSATTFKMVLEGDTRYLTHSGQFVNVAVEGKYLRRPISVCDYDDSTITLVYEIVGEGTRAMSLLRKGGKLDLLTGLGNGFDHTSDCRRPLLLGGGVGCAPLYNLAKQLLAEGREAVVILGFNTADDIVLADDFAELGISTFIATVDGTCGVKGFVTDVIRKAKIDYDYFYACGPMPMLRALCMQLPCQGQVSLDERMACGFGVCMCCSVETVSGAKRICKEGPVFLKNELIWK